MKEAVLDVIVVGAGLAGLSASYHLENYGLSPKVFEMGKISESRRYPHFFLGYRRMRRLLGIDCTVLVKKTNSSPFVV